jgi:hypothetical protein
MRMSHEPVMKDGWGVVERPQLMMPGTRNTTTNTTQRTEPPSIAVR